MRAGWRETGGDMPHSYTSCLMHCVFSMKDRQKIITPELQARLWPYMGGIAREKKMTALAVGGVEDHCHILLSIPSTIATSKAVQLIKGGSSKWVHDTIPGQRNFEWQEGYGAFSIGMSGIKETIAYINKQKEHHLKKTFKQEYRAFLKAHDLQYDEEHVWG
jgi:putative transposase